MREIKFRGLSENGQWVFGNYIEKINPTIGNPTSWASFIHDMALTAVEVVNNTVGQFTGLKDTDRKDIYEDDIVYIIHPCWSEKCIVEFKNGSFIFRCINLNDVQNVVIPGYTFMKEKWTISVIGNIHENPELLNE